MTDNHRLAPAFVDYVERHGIGREVYAVDVARFFRVSLRVALSVASLRDGLRCCVEPVAWMPSFFSAPSTTRLASSELYRNGLILGMDVSSAVAVHALTPAPTDHILDLCCAPGAKLLYLSQLQSAHWTPGSMLDIQGTVTGVDISPHRLATCRSLLKRHKAGNVRLFESDGTTFNVLAPHDSIQRLRAISSTTPISRPTIHSITNTLMKPFHAPKWLRNDSQLNNHQHLYDKVLVDAECTHDGSIAHVAKYGTVWDRDTMDQCVRLSDEKLQDLFLLQCQLIFNGWKLLKSGGIMIYSTCSLSRRQNEEIIIWFLQNHLDATLTSIPNESNYPHDRTYNQTYNQPELNQGIDLSHCLRFNPIVSQTSGLFIARLEKSFNSIT